MNWIVRIVAFLHMLLYIGIMWWGWQSYKVLRKKSWLCMGIGFAVLLVFRTEQFYTLVTHSVGDLHTTARQMWETFVPFVGASFLVASFWLLDREHQSLIRRMRMEPTSGTLPPEFWQKEFRLAVNEGLEPLRQEIKDLRAKLEA